MLRLRCLPLLAICASPASAQTSPGELASFLAAIRVSYVECRTRPNPSRLAQLADSQGFRIDEFLPAGRYHGLVSAEIDRLRARASADPASFCARVAERVRRSPLNRPPRQQARERQDGLLDLNRGSLEQLNRLGAGMIGRAIIYGRPYSSPEDLLDRRILNYRDFARIRNRITVR